MTRLKDHVGRRYHSDHPTLYLCGTSLFDLCSNAGTVLSAEPWADGIGDGSSTDCLSHAKLTTPGSKRLSVCRRRYWKGRLSSPAKEWNKYAWLEESWGRLWLRDQHSDIDHWASHRWFLPVMKNTLKSMWCQLRYFQITSPQILVNN